MAASVVTMTKCFGFLSVNLVNCGMNVDCCRNLCTRNFGMIFPTGTSSSGNNTDKCKLTSFWKYKKSNF
jgi:hypothetical protein